MKLCVDSFKHELIDKLHLKDGARVYVAYSGGLDSSVLLHLLKGVTQEANIDLVALHVNHKLSPQSDFWQMHCIDQCQSLGVALRYTSLDLEDASESTARKARYHWMSKQITYGDVLVTAHHQQDRAETFLFNLMRGAGSAGLSSLRAKRSFHGGTLMRPLLPFTKNQILEYAQLNNLDWVEDPSNQENHYSRNEIRNAIIPRLKDFREDAVRNISRAAENLERENGLLREVAIADLVDIREHPLHPLDGSYALCTDDLVFLSPARQANLIRFWLQSLNLHLPSQRFMAQILAAIDNPPSATAVLQEEGCQFRFYRGFMYVMNRAPKELTFSQVDWRDPNQPIGIFDDRLRVDAKPRLHELVSSQRRSTLRLMSREHIANPKAIQGHTLNLKKWLQDEGVPPWRRPNTPLLTLVKSKASESMVITPVDQQLHNDWISLDCPVNF